MNKIEEWLKQFPLPKFMPGDVVYISEGQVYQLKVALVTAYLDTEAEYKYTLTDEDDLEYYKDASQIYASREAAERVNLLRGLKERKKALSDRIAQASAEIVHLKALTPTGIEERIKECGDDMIEWTKALEDVNKQLKEIEDGSKV